MAIYISLAELCFVDGGCSNDGTCKGDHCDCPEPYGGKRCDKVYYS